MSLPQAVESAVQILEKYFALCVEMETSKRIVKDPWDWRDPPSHHDEARDVARKILMAAEVDDWGGCLLCCS